MGQEFSKVAFLKLKHSTYDLDRIKEVLLMIESLKTLIREAIERRPSGVLSLSHTLNSGAIVLGWPLIYLDQENQLMPPNSEWYHLVCDLCSASHSEIRARLSFFIGGNAKRIKAPHRKYLECIGINADIFIEKYQSYFRYLNSGKVEKSIRCPPNSDGFKMRIPEVESLEQLSYIHLKLICRNFGLVEGGKEAMIKALTPVFFVTKMDSNVYGAFLYFMTYMTTGGKEVRDHPQEEIRSFIQRIREIPGSTNYVG